MRGETGVDPVGNFVPAACTGIAQRQVMNWAKMNGVELKQHRVESVGHACGTIAQVLTGKFNHARIGAWAARSAGKCVGRYATMFRERVESELIQ